MPGGEHRVSSWHPPGHCPGSCLLICTWLPAPARAPRPPCEDSTRVVLTVPLLPVSSAEIKSRDWQLFALPVVQHKTTTSRAAWFTFTVFLRLTRTICSSSFGICRRIRDLPRRYSPDTQINSLGFKTDSENSAQQWHVAQFLGCVFFFFFFGLFLQFVKGKTDRFLEKKGKKNKKCQSKKRPIRGLFIMESSHVTLRENGNKMICQMGNRIRGLPIAEYLLPWCSFFFFFSLLEILPFSCFRNKF